MIALELAVVAVLLLARAVDVRSVEVVVHVSRCAVGVGEHVRPVEGPVLAPVAHGVEDLAARGVERFRHAFVAGVGDVGCARLAFVVAVVVSLGSGQSCGTHFL